MKSERGVTLTALVAYMGVFMIIIGIVTTISGYFYKNMGQIKETPQYISEFNKFSMFFVLDVKRNSVANVSSPSNIEFEDGTTYEYINNKIYRNQKQIAKNVKNFEFTQLNYTVNDFTKTIINVTGEFGRKNETITRNIDFVLKYW